MGKEQPANFMDGETIYTNKQFRRSVQETISKLEAALIAARTFGSSDRGYRDFDDFNELLKDIHVLHVQHYNAWHEEHHI